MDPTPARIGRPGTSAGADSITPDQLRALATTASGKYHNKKTWCEEIGRWFSSQREADAAVALWRRQQAGEIRGLAFQPRFPIEINDVVICTYVGDFAYEEWWDWANEWVPIVADAKGYRTDVFKIKSRLMSAVLGIEIKEL